MYELKVIRRMKKMKERASIVNGIHLTTNDKTPIQTGSKPKLGVKIYGLNSNTQLSHS